MLWQYSTNFTPTPFIALRNNGKMVSEITDGAEMLINDLKQQKLIVESLDDDHHEFERVASYLEHKLNQSTILYLMTAQGCNSGCGYCPVPRLPKIRRLVVIC